MSPIWGPLTWRAIPVVLVLAWFVLLIGGFSAGGAIHVLLVAAGAVFAYQLMERPSA